MPLRIGVDLGGTKIEAIALAPDGRILARERRPTPAGDYRATIEVIARLVGTLEARLDGQATVGVATPGSLSPTTGLLRNSNSVWLNGRSLDRDLGTALARVVRIANDADCFALSEAHDGAAAGANPVFGVILGTGVGGGIVVHGQLLAGVNAITGEWGHNPMPWPDDGERPGPDCYCGRAGCIETFLSGPGMADDFRRAAGRAATSREIVALAAAGDRAAAATLRRYEDRLARALATVINLLDPEVIVLGGGLSQIARWYETVPRLWRRHVFSDRVGTRLVAPRHGDSSGVRGAAWLWPV